MSKFVVDFNKVKQQGGGSISAFCHNNGFRRELLYGVNGRKQFASGSESQRIALALIELGVGKWDDEK